MGKSILEEVGKIFTERKMLEYLNRTHITLIPKVQGPQMLDIIMSCVSTVSTEIMFNGEALEPIYLLRGIRQGGPLSPYLFILYMEFLGQLIQEKCHANLWQPVKVS